MTALVSVVIPTFNRPDLLHHALSSVTGQRNAPGLIEAIVVNDGGVDVTATINAAREHGLPIRLINLAANRGLPAARNLGIDAARGEFLAFLDDDDVYLPDHLATMLAAIDRENVEAAYGVCAVSTTRVDPAQPFTATAQESYPFDADLLSVANFIPIHAAVLRRLPSGARFDARLTALEDWDMWLRLVREHDYRFHHVPQPTTIYHLVPSQDSMCRSAQREAAALAVFGKLAQQLWRSWPATTPAAGRFRLYIGVMYWHGLTLLTEDQQLSETYYQRCMAQIAAVWHGQQPEDGLAERIIETMKDGNHVGTAR